MNTTYNFWYCEALFMQSDSLKDYSSFYDYELLLSASVLKANNIVVKYIKNEALLDFKADTRQQIIKNYNPKIIFISVDANTVYDALNLCKEIRACVDMPLVAISPDLDFEMLYGAFDFVITGSNEYSSLLLYKSLLSKDIKLENIAGLIDCKTKKVSSCKSCIPEEINPLEISLSEPFLSTMYYSSRVYGKTVKYIPAEKVVDEITEIVTKYRIRHLTIADKNFMSDYERFSLICELLSKNKLDFKISCNADMEILYKYPQIAQKLAKAKIAVVSIDIDKNITLKQAEKIILNITSLKNICLYANIIIGNPKETIADFKNKFEFFKNMITLSEGFFLAFPLFFYPENRDEFYKNLGKYNIKSAEEYFINGYAGTFPIFETSQFSKEELLHLYTDFTTDIIKTNDKIFKKLSFETINFYYNLSAKYNIQTAVERTLNYNLFKNYFNYLNFPVFTRLENMSKEHIKEYIPMRVLTDSQYILLDNGYKLPGYGNNMLLKKPLEIAIYEYSSGKLNIGDIAARICKEHNLEITSDKFITKNMIPFYKRLEKNCQIIFQR